MLVVVVTVTVLVMRVRGNDVGWGILAVKP